MLFRSMIPGARSAGVGRFEAMIEPLGLSGTIPSDVRQALSELHALRNLIAHQAGRVDRRFRDTDFGATFQLYESIYLGELQFRNYFAAVHAYGHILSQRVAAAGA